MSKVALYHCDSFKRATSTLELIVDALGQDKISALFRNKRALIKPNVCIDFPPERGATTHPAALDAMISVAKDYGAEVVVGDGPVVGVKGKVFEKAGISEVCEKHGVELVNFNGVQGQKVKIDGGLALREALVAKTYFEVDTIVNLALFKSNILFWLSGALKNMKGFLVGTEKHKAHYLGVSKCVADLNRMLKQDLVVMDGLVGMMGDGPAMGRPANARLMMGSFDPVALDTAAAFLMGFPAGKIPMLKWSEQAGVGSTHFEIIGDLINSFKLDFDRPRIARIGPIGHWLDWMTRGLFPQLRKRSKIIIDVDKCSLCGRCVEMCPFDAVAIGSKSIDIDRDKCNLCLCCMEACANRAMEFKGILAHTDVFLR
jgi:uncharacterized protein (DUF362 family)/NAD-dependent dihydropyrimidine dehydrogenase PreA subunit